MLIFAIILVVIFALLAIFKYPSLSLVLFLSVGFFKTILKMKSSFFVRFDPTVLCGILLLLSMFYFFVKHRMPFSKLVNFATVLFVFLSVLLFLDWTWSTAPNYGFLKSSRVATLGFISLLAPLVFCSKMKDVQNIIFLLCVVGVILAIGTLVAPYYSAFRSGAEYHLRASFLEADPLDVALKMGAASLVFFYLLITADTSIKVKALSFGIIVVLMWAILLSGSRGAFWGLIITMLIAIFIARKKVSTNSIILFGLLGIFAIVLIITSSSELGIQRVVGVVRGEDAISSSSSSFSSRLDIFSEILKRLDEDILFGHGTGSYAFDFYGVDEKMYPHNILLELQYENGFIGLLVFNIFMLIVLRRWMTARRDATLLEPNSNAVALVHIIGLLLFYNLLQAMKSSDLDGERFLFMVCGLAMAAYNCIESQIDAGLLESEQEIAAVNLEASY